MYIPIITSAWNWASHQIAYYAQARPSIPNQESTLSSYETAPSSQPQTVWSMIKSAGRSLLNFLLSFFPKPPSAGKAPTPPPHQQVDSVVPKKTKEAPARSVANNALLDHPKYGLYLQTIKPEKLAENLAKIKAAVSLAEDKNRENRFQKKQIDQKLVGQIVIYALNEINKSVEAISCYCLSADMILEELVMHYTQDNQSILKMLLFRITEQLLHKYKDNALEIYTYLSTQHIDESRQLKLDKAVSNMILTHHSLNDFHYENLVAFLSDSTKVNLYLLAWRMTTQHPTAILDEEDKRALKELDEMTDSIVTTEYLSAIGDKNQRVNACANRALLLKFFSSLKVSLLSQ